MKKLNKKGFTIVELVIVIGVIGILSAILIPTFVNLTSQAQDTQIQSNLRNAYSAYIAEAVDGEMEVTGYFDGEGNAVTKVAITSYAQDKVALELDGKNYSWDGEKWADGATKGASVVEAAKYYLESTHLNDAAVKLSTFNTVVVYAKA